MRLPMIGDEVDIAQTKEMVDLFLKEGFTYFDTAHGYIQGKSEKAIKECLTSRYPRDKYYLANKLTGPYFKSESDIRPFFESQLSLCGVDYFDFYLMHAQNRQIYEHFKKCRAYETAFDIKKEGKIKHVGISFHDTADVLEEILTTYPEVEFVQLQFNYLDYNDAAVQSKLCYETCTRFGKPVVVMEPIKGGSLINLPSAAVDVIKETGVSPANLALRFAASPENIYMVLSGMSSIEQMKENVSFMKDFKPLNEKEYAATEKVASIIKSKNLIPCTACRYCVEGCPKKISIPDLFSLLNAKRHFNNWNADYYYHNVHTINHGKASECIKCGKCEKICPQKLPIRNFLLDVAKEFER